MLMGVARGTANVTEPSTQTAPTGMLRDLIPGRCPLLGGPALVGQERGRAWRGRSVLRLSPPQPPPAAPALFLLCKEIYGLFSGVCVCVYDLLPGSVNTASHRLCDVMAPTAVLVGGTGTAEPRGPRHLRPVRRSQHPNCVQPQRRGRAGVSFAISCLLAGTGCCGQAGRSPPLQVSPLGRPGLTQPDRQHPAQAAGPAPPSCRWKH